MALPIRSVTTPVDGADDSPASHGSSTTSRPRVAILGSRGIPAMYGGFETFAEELSARLNVLGVDVTVFCPWRPGPLPTHHRGTKLEYVKERSGLGPGQSLMFDFDCLWRARRDYDIVYMLGYGASPFCFLPRLFGTEVWINMDGLEWKRSKWSLPARLWLRFTEAVAGWTASRLVFDNAAVAEEVCGRGRKHTTHSVIEYGAPAFDIVTDEKVLDRFRLEKDGYYLVVSRFEPENQIVETIDAFEALDTDKQLVIVTNTDRDSAYARSTMARQTDRVRIVGPVYDDCELFTLRRSCFAYVHGHSVGGTNPSLLEAMGCGGLVIAHDNPYNVEVLRANGLYFDGAEDLRECMQECEEMSQEYRDSLAERCRERVATYYCWDRIAQSYAELAGVSAGESSDAEPKRATG